MVQATLERPQPTELRPYQAECLDRLVSYRLQGNRRALIALATGLGKAQPVDEPVLTPKGWKAIGNIRTGDKVIGQSGQAVRVIGVFPQGIQPIMTVRFSDGTRTRCNPDHLWAVRDKYDAYRNRSWRVLTTREIAESVDRRWRIPLVNPVEFPERVLPIEPYTMGVLLGDGGLTNAGYIRLHTDDAIVETLRWPEGVRTSVSEPIASGVSTYLVGGAIGCSPNPVMTALRDYGLSGQSSHTKFVPRPYMYASARQRLALLQGIMDSDGHVRAEDNHVEITLASGFLARDVRELVHSLGGTASITEKTTTWTHKGERKYGRALRLSIQMAQCPFRWKADRWRERTKYQPTRFVQSVETSNDSCEQVCIAVDAPDELYVTNDYVVTHNTEIFARLARAQNRVLVLAHREELLDQAATRITASVPEASVGIEQSDRHAEPDCKVVVASVQTFAMNPARLQRLDPREFSVVVVDEAHHCTARTYLEVLAHFGLVPDVSDLKDSELTRKEVSAQVTKRFKGFTPPEWAPFLVGCTATPSRSDGRGLEWVFDQVVFAMDIRAGIEAGWLAPLKGVRVQTGSSIAGVKTRGGDFIDKQLSNAVNNADRNALVVHAYEDHAVTQRGGDIAGLFGSAPDGERRQALVFCVDTDHARAVLEAFQRRGHLAGMVLGNTPAKERASTIAAYRRGELRVLVGVMVFTEGFDAPETSMVIMARPTKSSLVYTQAMGRCTRLAAGKKDAVVVDLEDAGRVGVQNLNTMFGLPPKLNLGKDDVLSVKRAVEEHESEVSQERLLEAQSLADIERMAEEFDPIAVAGLPAHVQQATKMAWIKTTSGYALSVMGEKGGDIGVVVDMLGHAHVRFRPREFGLPKDIGEFATEMDALQAAEAWVREERDEVARLMERNASWRVSSDPASDKQRNMLKRLGVKDLPDGLTKGQASMLIDRQMARKKKGV